MRLLHTMLRVVDLEATCERVRSSEGERMSEPHEMKDGPVMAFARDPDGYAIELLPHDVFERLARRPD